MRMLPNEKYCSEHLILEGQCSLSLLPAFGEKLWGTQQRIAGFTGHHLAMRRDEGRAWILPETDSFRFMGHIEMCGCGELGSSDWGAFDPGCSD